MSGVPKQAVNAIRASAFLLEELEETAINETIRIAFDSQITELASDMKILVEDTGVKVDQRIKDSFEQVIKDLKQAQTPPGFGTQTNTTARNASGAYPHPCASALVNPPPNVNPVLAAKEGIRARQFLMVGPKDSALDIHDTQKMRADLNKTAKELGLSGGKIRSSATQKDGSILIEVDSDAAAIWFNDGVNRAEFCSALGDGFVFKTRIFNVLAFNAPLNLDPSNDSHMKEINEANDLDDNNITAIRWAKPIDRRTDHQRSAHLVLSFSSPDEANRAITNGIIICNKKCHVEKIRREPIRCLKCQRWNHMAKDCTERGNTCSNCAGTHRTASCLHPYMTRCVSCHSDDHASWSRQGPTFLKRVVDFKERNPESSMPYFPTADHWTWSTDIANPTHVSKGNSSTKSNDINVHQQKAKAKGKEPSRSQGTARPGEGGTHLGEEPNLNAQAHPLHHSWWDEQLEAIPGNPDQYSQSGQTNQPPINTRSGTAGPSNV